MFNGAHLVIYSNDAEADRAFFRDVLGYANIDAGDGWLIFALPPAELAVHPHESSKALELYLMCDDIQATRRLLTDAGVASASVEDQGWGLLSSFELPGGARIGFYQPRHSRPA